MVNKQKILVNIFSNWTNLFVLIVTAFFVSPIVVHQLGNELYGIWTLIVNLTGYFTVLDLGVNTAIVRFVSMYTARKDPQKANEVYNTSFIFFFLVSLVIISVTAVFGFFFPDLFAIKGLTKSYVYLVFVIAGIDIACSLLFGVFAATLNALQEFLMMNIASIALTLLKNGLLIILLWRGSKLLTLALIQLAFNGLKHLALYGIIRRKYGFFQIRRSLWKRSVLRQVFTYSIYSFIIAIAGRIIFLTDSIVIGSVIRVSEITFFAIPATLLDYLGKIIGSLTSVLVPVISSHDAVGEGDKNRTLYLTVSKYVLLLSLPVIFVLFTVGDDFISIWMGPEYGVRSLWVLRILLTGYLFSFPQWIAYSILLGTSRHRFTAYVLSIEAIANLGMSIVLGKIYGIEGVALGTTLPLLVVNIFVFPVYTCKFLKIPIFQYYQQSHLGPLAVFILAGVVYTVFPITITTYLQLCLYSLVFATLWGVIALMTMVEAEHRQWVVKGVRQKLARFRSP
jgi:O-antigen/teichoic acid export membrane protein